MWNFTYGASNISFLKLERVLRFYPQPAHHNYYVFNQIRRMSEFPRALCTLKLNL